MGKSQELDAALRRLNGLSNDLEALIHRRSKALDARATEPDVQGAEREALMGTPPESESLEELTRSMDGFFKSGARRSAVCDAAFRKRMHAALDRVMRRLKNRGQRAAGKRARAADSAETATQIINRRRLELRARESQPGPRFEDWK